MNRSFSLLSAVFLCPCFLFAQPAVVARDTLLVQQWLDTGQRLRGSAPDSAGYYGQRATALSRKLDYPKGEVKGLILSSYPLLVGGKFREAEARCTEARDLALRHGFQAELAIAWNNLGICCMNTGQTERAIEALIAAANAFGAAGQPAMQAKVLGNLGSTLMMTGQDERAATYLADAYRISLLQKDTLSAAHFLLNLALVRKHLNDTAQAYQHTLEVYHTGTRYQNLELVYGAAINLADAELGRGHPEKAMQYWDEAYEKALRMGSPDKTALPLYGQAAYFFQTGNPVKARDLLVRSLTLSEASGEKVRLRNAFKLMAEVQHALHEDAAAYSYQLRYQQLDEQIRSADVQKNIHALEARYQSEKKERTLAQQRLALATTSWALGILALALLAAIVIAGLMRRGFRQKQALAGQVLETLRTRQEAMQLDALMQGEERERSRVARELHDGVGGLLAAAQYQLSALSGQAPLEKAMEMLQAASRETRAISHRLLPEHLLQRGIEASLRAYCASLAEAGKVRVIFQAMGEAGEQPPGKTELALFRIAQELISNALRHARATEILVQLTTGKEGYLLAVEDDGVGFDTEQIAEGIGLANLRQRAALFGGTISWDSRPGSGTAAEVSLPFASPA